MTSKEAIICCVRTLERDCASSKATLGLVTALTVPAPAFILFVGFFFATTVNVVSAGAMPSFVVPRSWVGSNDILEIDTLPCILRTTCEGSARPSVSTDSEPKPNCRYVPVSSCSITNLRAAIKGFKILLTPSREADLFVVSTKTTS